MIRKREWVVKTFGVSHPVASMALAVPALVTSSAVLPSEAEAQDGQDGQAPFQRHCSGCHPLDDDHEDPRLLGRGGKNSGHGQKLFQYSEALKNAKHRWDEGTLDKWLTDTSASCQITVCRFEFPNERDARLSSRTSGACQLLSASTSS
jgi:cytochrome c2